LCAEDYSDTQSEKALRGRCPASSAWMQPGPGVLSDRHRRILMQSNEIDKLAVIELLNRILEAELAGVVRYTHYSFMVYGYNRIPIVHWLRGQAEESLGHAEEAGEYITALGGHPSLAIGKLLETEKHDVGAILRESLEHEREAFGHYRALLELVEGRDIMLEEYARRMVAAERKHASEVDKMLRAPGALEPFAM
jgi:bacterioferritin